ncbi:hypothetical protein AAY473_030630 [Plecturocebus cupreus]
MYYLIESSEQTSRLECSGTISAHCNLRLPGAIEMRFHHVGQAGLELLTSSDQPALHYQSAGITGSTAAQSAHCNLCFLSSSDSFASASQVAWTTETGFCHVGQTGLELLASSDLPALASQSAGIIGISHHTQLLLLTKAFKGLLREKDSLKRCCFTSES